MEVATLSFVRTPGHANDPQPTKTDNGRTPLCMWVNSRVLRARRKIKAWLAATLRISYLGSPPYRGGSRLIRGDFCYHTPRLSILVLLQGGVAALSAGPSPPPVRKIPFDGSQDAPDTSDDDRTSLQGAKPQRRRRRRTKEPSKFFPLLSKTSENSPRLQFLPVISALRCTRS